MIKLLVRIAFLAFGCALLADIFLPLQQQPLVVDQHTSSVTQRPPHSHVYDTSYTLHFAGGKPDSCSVGYVVYGTMQDGDKVTVRSTKVLGNCVDIDRDNGEVILRNKYWRLWELLGVALALAVGFGLLEFDTDTRYRAV